MTDVTRVVAIPDGPCGPLVLVRNMKEDTIEVHEESALGPLHYHDCELIEQLRRTAGEEHVLPRRS